MTVPNVFSDDNLGFWLHTTRTSNVRQLICVVYCVRQGENVAVTQVTRDHRSNSLFNNKISPPMPIPAHNTASVENTASMQTWLPIELWEEIIGFCAQSDQVIICRVSKQFNLLATRMVYRKISCQYPEQVIGCCRTLVRNSSAALCVRIFNLFSL